MVGTDDDTKRDWLIQACNPKIRKMVDSLADKTSTFEELLESISQIFPKVENSISIRQQLAKVQMLSREATPSEVETLLLEIESLFLKLPPNTFSEEEKTLLLVSKIPPPMLKEIQTERAWRSRCDTFESLKDLLREKAKDDALERHIFNQMQKRDKTFFMADDAFSHQQFAMQEHGKGKGKGGRGKGETPNSSNQTNSSNPFPLTQIMTQASQGKGKGKGTFYVRPPQFKAKIVCKFCKKTGHYESDCWTKEKVERQKKQEDKKKQIRMPRMFNPKDKVSHMMTPVKMRGTKFVKKSDMVNGLHTFWKKIGHNCRFGFHNFGCVI